MFNLTPGSDYTCRATDGSGNIVGQLDWNNTTKTLTIKGKLYIDGSVYSDNGVINLYSGSATLYLTGVLPDHELDEDLRRDRRRPVRLQHLDAELEPARRGRARRQRQRLQHRHVELDEVAGRLLREEGNRPRPVLDRRGADVRDEHQPVEQRHGQAVADDHEPSARSADLPNVHAAPTPPSYTG